MKSKRKAKMKTEPNDTEKLSLTIVSTDEREMQHYLKAKDMSAFISEFEENLKSYSRHGLPQEISNPQQALGFIKDVFFDLKYEHIVKAA